MNGVNERNHATADITVRKILDDEQEKTLQKAVNEASFTKNSQITAKGFSPFQLEWGQNPTIPGLSEGTTGSLENVTESEVSRKILQAQTQNMIRANQVK